MSKQTHTASGGADCHEGTGGVMAKPEGKAGGAIPKTRMGRWW